MTSTFAFLLLCALGGSLVYIHRPGSRAGLNDYAWLMAVLLPVLSGVLFFAGSYEGYGKRLSLTIGELRIPLADVKDDGVYFIAGPKREESDFVVGSYADAQQSAETYRDEFDGILTIQRIAGAWAVCGKQVDPTANLPGMGVKIGDVPLKSCTPLGTDPQKVKIERIDVGGALQTRRNFAISLNEEFVRIELGLGEALTRHVGKCDGKNADFVLRLAPAGLHAPDRGYLIPRNQVFDQLGQGGKLPLLKRDALGSIGTLGERCKQTPASWNWPAATQSAAGASNGDSNARLVISSRSTSLAWWILLLLCASPLWLWFFCSDHWKEGPGRTEAALVLTLTWLLALRLITAMAGLFNNDGLSQAAVLWPPAMAFVVVPMLAIGLLRAGDADARKGLLGIAAQLPFMLLLIFLGLDGELPGVQEGILAGVAIALLFWRPVAGLLRRIRMLPPLRRLPPWFSLSKNPAPLLVSVLDSARPMGAGLHRTLGSAASYLVAKFGLRNAALLLFLLLLASGFAVFAIVYAVAPTAGPFKARLTGFPLFNDIPLSILFIPAIAAGAMVIIVGFWLVTRAKFDAWHAGALLVLTLITGRFALLAIGYVVSPSAPLFKERFSGIPVVQNIPLSAMYIPPLIIGIALMITGYRAVPSLARAIMLGAAFFVSFIAVGFAASDFGMIWIFALPAGWAIATLYDVKPLGGSRGQAGLTRAILVLPVLTPVLLAVFYYNFRIPDVPPPTESLSGHVEAVAKWDRTAARLQRYWNPDRLIDAGSSASFEMLEQGAQLEPLTRDFWGNGFLAPSGVVSPLLKYQYSDNLLAVHIIWPFGRLGMAAFLAALLATLWAFWRPRGDGGAGEGWRGEAARLAVMIFFWSAAYMALANLNLMPFTGRNAYLLASQSMGDLAEGFLLLLLIVFPILAVRSNAGQKAEDA